MATYLQSGTENQRFGGTYCRSLQGKPLPGWWIHRALNNPKCNKKLI
jgi:hypothetical protein